MMFFRHEKCDFTPLCCWSNIIFSATQCPHLLYSSTNFFPDHGQESRIANCNQTRPHFTLCLKCMALNILQTSADTPFYPYRLGVKWEWMEFGAKDMESDNKFPGFIAPFWAKGWMKPHCESTRVPPTNRYTHVTTTFYLEILSSFFTPCHG